MPQMTDAELLKEVQNALMDWPGSYGRFAIDTPGDMVRRLVEQHNRVNAAYLRYRRALTFITNPLTFKSEARKEAEEALTEFGDDI